MAKSFSLLYRGSTIISFCTRKVRASQPSTDGVQLVGEMRTSPLPLPDQGAFNIHSPIEETNSLTCVIELHIVACPHKWFMEEKDSRTSTQRCRPDRKRNFSICSFDNKYWEEMPAICKAWSREGFHPHGR